MDNNLDFQFITDFLAEYMPYSEIEWYLGFGFVGILICTALGALIFENKKRSRWIGALLGSGVSLIAMIIIPAVRPYVQEGIYLGYSPGIMMWVGFFSCVGVSIPAFLAMWLLVQEGRLKNMENPFMQPYAQNYMPINPGVGGGMPAPTSYNPTATNEMQSVYHQAPRPVTGPISSNFTGLNPNRGSIFISYRRNDSAELVGRMYDHLVARFGKDAIFRDIEAIPLGVDFRQYLRTVVGNCGILLAVIGDKWLDMKDDAGNLRLNNPDDFVRIEIASALQRNVPVVPVLIRNTQMPKADELPDDIAELAFRNNTQVRSDADFYSDMERLFKAIEVHLQ